MDVDRSGTALPVRAWHAWRDRGTRYAWHKALRRSLGRWPGWKRRLVYADPRDYWTLRGGDDYFREQEGQPARTARAEWLAGRIASLPARRRSSRSAAATASSSGRSASACDVPMVGVDFSPTQLGQAREYLDGLDGIDLVLASGAGCRSPTGRSTWC